jgi:DNA-binding NarL/FixJ family response regulator
MTMQTTTIQNGNKHRVLIVDDHPLFREGLKSLINRSDNYQTIAEAGNSEEALLMARRFQPDLVTMDMSLPGLNGAEATRKVLEAVPQARVLMVTMHPDYQYIAEAFRSGVKGYVVKETTSSQLIEAMDTLVRGEVYVDTNASKEMVHNLIHPETGQAQDEEAYGSLSRREQEIMRLVVEGVTSREIADQLGLKQKTVENHRGNLMKKLDVHNKMELVRYAVRLGLIDVDSWKN